MDVLAVMDRHVTSAKNKAETCRNFNTTIARHREYMEAQEARAAVAELVEAAGLALADHEQEGIALNADTVTALRAAIAKFGGAK